MTPRRAPRTSPSTRWFAATLACLASAVVAFGQERAHQLRADAPVAEASQQRQIHDQYLTRPPVDDQPPGRDTVDLHDRCHGIGEDGAVMPALQVELHPHEGVELLLAQPGSGQFLPPRRGVYRQLEFAIVGNGGAQHGFAGHHRRLERRREWCVSENGL